MYITKLSFSTVSVARKRVCGVREKALYMCKCMDFSS